MMKIEKGTKEFFCENKFHFLKIFQSFQNFVLKQKFLNIFIFSEKSNKNILT